MLHHVFNQLSFFKFFIDNIEDADVTSQSDQETINKELKKKRKVSFFCLMRIG